MTLVAAQGMIPCRINERRCLIVIYKFYWSLPGVIVTISGENKTNYTHHTTASSQPITNGKSPLWRWRWKSIFLMQKECLNRCAKIYLRKKFMNFIQITEIQILYHMYCLRLSIACWLANMMWIFLLFHLTSFWGLCISGYQYQCIHVPLLRPAMRYLLCWCWDVADWVLPNAALCHSAKWSSGHLWSAQPNCAQTTPDIETQPHTTQTRAHTFTSLFRCPKKTKRN